MAYTPRPWPAPAHEPIARLEENLALAEIPGLARLVPSHGDVVEERAPEVLREVARRLRRDAVPPPTAVEQRASP